MPPPDFHAQSGIQTVSESNDNSLLAMVLPEIVDVLLRTEPEPEVISVRLQGKEIFRIEGDDIVCDRASPHQTGQLTLHFDDAPDSAHTLTLPLPI